MQKDRMLTKVQKETLDFIRKFSSKNGYYPSIEEICKEFKLKSFSSAVDRIQRLVSKGFLFKEKYKPRGLKLNKGIEEDILDFVRKFNSRVFNHPKRYKSLIRIIKEFKEQL